jgi:hypothetical protein
LPFNHDDGKEIMMRMSGFQFECLKRRREKSFDGKKEVY